MVGLFFKKTKTLLTKVLTLGFFKHSQHWFPGFKINIIILLTLHKLQFKISLSSGSKEDPVLCVSGFHSSAGYSPSGFYAARRRRYSYENTQTYS